MLSSAIVNQRLVQERSVQRGVSSQVREMRENRKAYIGQEVYIGRPGRPSDVECCHLVVCMVVQFQQHIPDVLRTKLDPKSELCIFVGYSETQKAYRFWNPNSSKIVISRDAIFCEEDKTFISNQKEKDEGPFHPRPEKQPHPGVHRYPTRVRKQAIPRSSLHALIAETTLQEPLTYEDTMSSPDAQLWEKTMEEDLTA